MHSFHHSRGRILFETACALTISGSCVAAWMDLGVPAFLPAAAVSALYGLVHLFDMRRPKPVAVFAAPAVELEAGSERDLPVYGEEPAPWPVAEPEPVAVAEAKPVEEPKPRTRKRKSSKKAEPVAAADPREAEPILEAEPVVEAEPVAEAPIEAAPIEPESYDEPEDHAPVTPLFEPEPYVRQQQRAVFGRKAS